MRRSRRLLPGLVLVALTGAAWSAGDDERIPVRTVVPAYPELAQRERVEGDVQVCFNVDRDGRVRRPRVRTSTDRIFEKPAIRAARESSYKPLPEGERPSGIKTCRTFRFRLSPVAIEKPS